MKSYITEKSWLCIILLSMLLCMGCSGQRKDENLWSRHAFMVEDDLIFIADVPEEWRYVLRPVYNYLYYEELVEYDGNYHAVQSNYDYAERYVEFVSRSGEYDGLDNFFRIYASRDGFKYIENRYSEENGVYHYRLEQDVIAETDCKTFIFEDGTQGEWKYWITDEEETVPYSKEVKTIYRGIIYDIQQNFGMGLWMLQSEYSQNERTIARFLESVCFRTSDLGISEETNVLKRDLLTLHIWNEYMCMTLSVPEGISIVKDGGNIIIYFDEDKENKICFYPDSDADILEPSGDFDYFLNSKDFEETVYEIPGKGTYRYVFCENFPQGIYLPFPGVFYEQFPCLQGYYFANQYIMMFLDIDEKNAGLQQLAKEIAQSVRFR